MRYKIGMYLVWGNEIVEIIQIDKSEDPPLFEVLSLKYGAKTRLRTSQMLPLAIQKEDIVSIKGYYWEVIDILFDKTRYKVRIHEVPNPYNKEDSMALSTFMKHITEFS